jgi:hypothetical protein
MEQFMDSVVLEVEELEGDALCHGLESPGGSIGIWQPVGAEHRLDPPH